MGGRGDLYGRRYAEHFERKREMARAHRADKGAAARTAVFDDRFGRAIKQTQGNIKAAMSLIAEWEAAEKVGSAT